MPLFDLIRNRGYREHGPVEAVPKERFHGGMGAETRCVSQVWGWFKGILGPENGRAEEDKPHPYAETFRMNPISSLPHSDNRV